MAEKKTASRAEQAVSGAKKKTSSGSASKPSGKKSTSAKNTKYKTEYERAVPPIFSLRRSAYCCLRCLLSSA